MIKRFKSFLWVVFLASGLQASWGFALLGPPAGYPGLRADFGDAWQTAVIGYDLAYADESSLGSPGGPVFLGDIGGPKNIGEEYRRNARTIYYAYDANFLGFFGTEGATAADGAFAIMNSLTNVTSYSRDLSEFPLNSQHFNYRAQSLFLMDVKSVTLHLLIEQMGLAEPERFSWTLAERFLPSGGVCPVDEIYLVLQRNFDFKPTALNQIQYSSYVNDVLYSYYIVEICTGPNPLAITVPFAVDPLVEQYTAVAANNGDAFGGLRVGGFYTGLTRDDAAGLRYLLATNNVNWESAAAGSILTGSTTIGVTNLGLPFLLFASNYTAFVLSARTNDPVTLSNLFPGLVIVNSSYYFTNMATPNIVAYFTNFIGAPFGSPPTPVVTTNGFTSSYSAIYSDTFANLIIINEHPNTSATLVTVSVTNQIGAPFGNPLVTNTSTKTITLTNVPSGEYYISTNPCGPDLILSTLGTNVTATTNLVFSATNSAGYSISQSVVTYSTNHVFVAQPIICSSTVTGGATNATGLYQGIDNVKFVRANFDSLIGQYFQPITNTYTMVGISGSKAQSQTFQRVITQPDILLSANNFIAANTFNGSVSRNINFDTANVLPGLAGPGVINSPTTFNYNKIGDAFRNGSLALVGLTTNAFLSEFQKNQPTLAWASFDSSTNDPVVYPNGTSIQNLENQILVQISPASLPNGTSGVSYPATTFTASGGSFSPPFTWSATGLPPGLTLSSGGTLSGTPTQSGTFNFVIQLNDSLTPPRTVRWNYTITIP